MTLCDVARLCELADAPDPGAKHDLGKPRYDLLPAAAEAEIVDVLTYGAEKYSPDNWRHVTDPVERYYSALRRHLAAWRLGEELDSESGLRHLAHVATNAVFLMELTRKEQAK